MSKTTWNLVKSVTNQKNTSNILNSMNINDRLSDNHIKIANAFNTYFISAAEKLLVKNLSGHKISDSNASLFYVQQNFKQSFHL
jgi:D-hexose-6-phosphate mutarotase